MSYTALYRRFRPQLFSELIGQEHISRTLAAAIRQGSFVHAYLLCGPRGTGKTSTARIMARAVNCLQPTEQGEPCGLCAACLRSIQGEAIDILEIDAASNRGIDEIRDLRERVKYAPALEKYKVYIIDEVHMLTAPAFNALLKTLEEPPTQVLFILATTEPHKLPLTVLSRCQRFDFRRIADTELAAHLAQVADAEGYTADTEALALIARKSEGGMRDALGLLDQCAGFNNGSITVAALNKLTGAVDADFIEQITRHMLDGNAATLLTMIAQLHEAGRDLRQFLADLLEYQRELLLAKLSPGKQDIPEWALNADSGRLIRLMQSLSDGDGRLRTSLQPRLTLELALLNACDIGGQRTEDRGQKKAAPPESPRHGASAALSTPPPVGANCVRPPEDSEPTESGAPTDFERLQQLWPQIMREVNSANAGTGALLQQAQPHSINKNHLVLLFEAKHTLYMKQLCNPGPARTLLEQKIEAICGSKLSLDGKLGEAREETPPPPPPQAPPEEEQASLF